MIGLAFASYVSMLSLNHNLKKSGPKKILIIDDDEDLREAFVMAFRQEDYQVLAAHEGQEGMEILESLKKEELPDLIILDYQMPRMDGRVFSHLKADNPRFASIPVVLLSACGNKYEVRQKTVADAYIEKPLELNRLLDIAHQFIYH